jgi:DNA polymerase-3 subunit epsilon
MQNVEEPPRRNNPDKELIAFFDGYQGSPIIVFDLETNGFQKSSVLSITAIKFTLKEGKYEEVDIFNRFYYPVEEFSKGATDVNGLTKEVLDKKRSRVSYAEHFKEDADFPEFCKGVNYIIGHNVIGFDSKFIDWKEPVKFFDTMTSNSDVVCKEWWPSKRTWKYPKLMETAKHFGIEVEENNLHGSKYDTELTLDIFIENVSRAIENGSLKFKEYIWRRV